MDRAAQAGVVHNEKQQAEQEKRESVREILARLAAERMATGTDDATPRVSALDMLATTDHTQDGSNIGHRTPQQERPDARADSST